MAAHKPQRPWQLAFSANISVSSVPKSSREKYYTKIDELGETPQILENLENLLNTDELCAEKFKTIFCLDRKPREKQIEEFKKAYKETPNIWN